MAIYKFIKTGSITYGNAYIVGFDLLFGGGVITKDNPTPSDQLLAIDILDDDVIDFNDEYAYEEV